MVYLAWYFILPRFSKFQVLTKNCKMIQLEYTTARNITNYHRWLFIYHTLVSTLMKKIKFDRYIIRIYTYFFFINLIILKLLVNDKTCIRYGRYIFFNHDSYNIITINIINWQIVENQTSFVQYQVSLKNKIINFESS